MGTKDSAHDVPFCNFSGRCLKRRKQSLFVPRERKPAVKEEMLVEASSLNINTENAFSRGVFMKKCTKTCITEVAPIDRLVKIELDAAQALAEFSRIAHLPAPGRPLEEDVSGLHWFGKKKRSTRSCKEGTSGKLDQNFDFSWVGDKSLIQPASPIHLNKKSISDVDVYKCEEFLEETTKELDSLLMTEINEQDSRSMPESSKESMRSDLRADSPSSPLPPCQLQCRSFLAGRALTNSAFQRVIPLRPIRKSLPTPAKPKVEGISCKVEHFSSGQTIKSVVKRKSKFGRPLSSFATAKVMVAADVYSPMLSTTPKSESPSYESKSVSQAGAQESAVVKSIPNPLIEESRHRLVNRSKPALTEMEKEVRRLRRVQANRESARQTIRRKQVLCEELTRKASRLKIENESMKQEKELLLQELNGLSKRNHQLKEQLLLHSGGESAQSFPSQLKIAPLQHVSLPPSQVPFLPYGSVPLQSFVWYFTLAQAAAASQASMLQSCDVASGVDFNPVTYANSLIPGLCMGTNENSQQQLPHFLFPYPFMAQLANEQLCDVSNLPTLSSQVSNPLVEREAIVKSAEKDLVQSAELFVHKGEEEAESQVTQAGKRESQGATEFLFSPCQKASSGCQMQSSAKGLLQSEVSVDIMSHKCQTSQVYMEKDTSTSAERTSLAVVASGPGYCLGNTIQLSKAPSSHGILGGFLEGSQQTNPLTGRKVTAAAVAAAAARRRRKELTRSKVHSRPFRLPC